MSGSLIFVSGFSGAGKSTLIRAALNNSPNLIYLTTLTTRPRRDGENDTIEYEFATEDEYEESRANSKEWDHSEYGGYKYGADVEFIRQRLAQGTDVICSVAPDQKIINEMIELYKVHPVMIWIDTPKDVAKARVADDSIRNTRSENDEAKQHFAQIFQPTGDLDHDRAAFTKLIQDLTK